MRMAIKPKYCNAQAVMPLNYIVMEDKDTSVSRKKLAVRSDY